ncbi:DUF3306 domain-containing protein [Variovorax sp. J22R133]|uniref:DUF3306 domain-containing protein n=1 Tax=Variovorax brevis TaxID=3053503 RepID=UPI002575E7FF|nr:DUF3306 domain-containing protein [Variovorax sp. J22R133]MDM0111573.1 DUF3306 domain-containing protein [Variovorax sp. J22R133]
MSEDESFFKRWSRRKQEVAAESEPLPTPPEEGRGGGTTALVDPTSPRPGLPPEGEGEKQEPSPLTLADTESLTLDSDFKPFLASNVAPEVKNAAFRKLFADPHFNVMDRLDIYIDDYSKPSPLSEATLRQMASARFLKLFDDDEEDDKKKDQTPPASPDAKAEEAHASQPVASAAEEAQQLASQPHDDPENADLRLQPDDAARAEDARRRAG